MVNYIIWRITLSSDVARIIMNINIEYIIIIFKMFEQNGYFVTIQLIIIRIVVYFFLRFFLYAIHIIAIN